jgi:hypothetical protein
MAKNVLNSEVLRRLTNVGSYVCRNLGLLQNRLHWLTVHHTDNLTYPYRIQQHVQVLTAANALEFSGRMLCISEPE